MISAWVTGLHHTHRPADTYSAKQEPVKDDLPPLNAETTRKHYYGEKARVYDEKQEGSEKARLEREAVRELLKGKTGTVLDIPCGTGRFFDIYEEYGLIFSGIDISTEMLEFASKKWPTAALYNEDIMEMSVPNEEVDYAVCIRMLNFFEEDELRQAVKELARVTRKEIICGFFMADRYERRRRCHAYPFEVLNKAMKDVGFEPKEDYPIRPDYHVFSFVRA